MRCFVAVEMPDAVREALAATAERLREAAPRADVRWVPPGSMHLTLRFLGEVPEPWLEALVGALAGVAGGHSPIALRLAGVGTFPGPSRPRVVWAGLADGAAAAGRLAADVDRAVVVLGVRPEARPFRAHVTLGRVRSPRGVRRIVRAIEALADASFGHWTAGEMALLRSHLSPHGARYEALARVALAVVARP